MYDLYSRSSDDRHRYVLGQNGKKKIFVIGLNPSTATQEKSDTTVAKVEEVAFRTGYHGFVMLNLYPVRATDYNTLPHKAEPRALAKNFAAIEEVLAAERQPVIWAAWGQSILARKFFLTSANELASRLHRFDPKWLHFGQLTSAGHPRHPSRLSYAWGFSPFDIHAYVVSVGA